MVMKMNGNKNSVIQIKTTDLEKHNIGKVDYFMSFCGFQKRCLSVPSHFPTEDINKAIVFMNEEPAFESLQNRKKLESLLGDRLVIRPVKLFDPLSIADAFIEELKIIREATKNPPHILLDITSFTHESLLILFALIKQFLPDANVDCIYTCASSYASECDNNSEKWLSRGIREVRSVLGYAGAIQPSQDTVLIVMAGYEYERAWHLIDDISPEELIITYNDDCGSTDQTNGAANSEYAKLLHDLAAYYQNPKQYVIPSNNPFDTAKKLKQIVDTISNNMNIIVAPMNNKLATIGAALVAIEYPRIQLCYAPAVYYNTANYSIEGDSCYLFSINDNE